MCNKVNYVSRRDARSAARWMERTRGVTSQHAYRCQRCGFWHLTTMSRERAKADVRARKERRRGCYHPGPFRCSWGSLRSAGAILAAYHWRGVQPCQLHHSHRRMTPGRSSGDRLRPS